ncbi:MAG: hypothetical protein JWR09_2390 [Mucilaginibacter sp.]|nr:hypothetical protein [Mucilaginibacter sp.]
MKKTFQTLIGLLFTSALFISCDKRSEIIAPVTENHNVALTADGYGYKVMVSLEQKETITPLDSANVVSNSTYNYNATFKNGEHLLITISPNNPTQTNFRYNIEDNGSSKANGYIGNVTVGSAVTIHYPRE